GASAGASAVWRPVWPPPRAPRVEAPADLAEAAETLARSPVPPSKGPGILTFSGAFCAIAHDFCESIGFDVPPLSPQSIATMRQHLPSFVHPNNPLDLTTQPIWQPELVGIGAKTLLDDPAIGSLVISITVGGPAQSVLYMKGLIKALEGNKKPVVFSILGDTSPLAPEFLALAREHRIILSRSSERSLRAMAQVTAYGKHPAVARSNEAAKPFVGIPKLGSGPQVEWVGKQVLA